MRCVVSIIVLALFAGPLLADDSNPSPQQTHTPNWTCSAICSYSVNRSDTFSQEGIPVGDNNFVNFTAFNPVIYTEGTSRINAFEKLQTACTNRKANESLTTAGETLLVLQTQAIGQVVYATPLTACKKDF